MPELAELARLANIGAGGLCALFFWLVFTGRLVPRSTVDKLVQQETQRAEDFKAAHTAADARADKLLEQQEQLLTYARTADVALTALKQAAERGRR